MAVRLLKVVFIASVIVRVVVAAEVLSAPEYRIKAAFLYYFARFVDWPDKAFATPDAPFVIGVLGKNPFGDELEAVVGNRTIKGHHVVVRSFERIEECRACHLIFVSRSEERRLTEILQTLKRLPVLSMGESEEFTLAGGMVALERQGEKVRYVVNKAAADDASLRISSQILTSAVKILKATQVDSER
jgi:hypothetical protein